MKAILTTYHGPTDVRGSRVIAKDEDNNRVTLSWRPELRSEENHSAACVALCRKMQWTGKLHGGHVKRGMVWVWVDPMYAIEV